MESIEQPQQPQSQQQQQQQPPQQPTQHLSNGMYGCCNKLMWSFSIRPYSQTNKKLLFVFFFTLDQQAPPPWLAQYQSTRNPYSDDLQDQYQVTRLATQFWIKS